MKINESNYDLILSARNKTGIDYEVKWFDAENIDGYMDEEEIWRIIEDLITEIDIKDEKLEEINNPFIKYPNEEADRERQVLGI